MKFMLSMVVVAAASAGAMGQTTVDCQWQVSLDNGATWQTGSVSAPQSQGSVLVRARATVLDNGVPFLDQTRARFAEGAMEAYVTSATIRLDQAGSVRVLVPALPATLGLTPFSVSQHGTTLKIDRFPDVGPPGQGAYLLTRNVATSTGGTPSKANPLTILQYQLTLDGSLGDRVMNGGFFAFSGTGGWVIGANQVAVYPPSGPETVSAAQVNQSAVTLTIIPAPASTAAVVGGVMLALRRRR